MPELRKDPIIGRWVIIATERAKRPSDFKKGSEPAKRTTCNYCEGNESKTPPEVLAIRRQGTKPNTPGWETRIIPSPTTFFKSKGDLDRHGNGLYDLMNGIGIHEILIMCPEHTGDVHNVSDMRISRMVELLGQRMKLLREDKRLKYLLVFANHGKEAGGLGIGHLHMQLIATPVTPKRVKEKLVGAKKYFDYKDRCVFCDIIKQEIAENQRVVCQIDGFIAITPFCSRFPFEVWILPMDHCCDVDKTDAHHMKSLGKIYKNVFARMNKVLGTFPFNTVLHTAPFRRGDEKRHWHTIEQDFHWHLEIMPRLTQVAGFEWGSGFYINPIPPEDACKALKEVKL
jgi:UDPglucose--hexose-1-phosphate uridylyltransferase